MAENRITYRSKKGRDVVCTVSGHAIIRFVERYSKHLGPVNPLRLKLLTMPKSELLALMQSQLETAKRVEHGKEINDRRRYEGGTIFFANTVLRFVFANSVLVTVESVCKRHNVHRMVFPQVTP